MESVSNRELFVTTPTIKWEEIGGLDVVKRELERYIVAPFKHPDDWKYFGLGFTAGVLLYGPMGCGKSLIAKAIANHAGASFIDIKSLRMVGDHFFPGEVHTWTARHGVEGGWVYPRIMGQLLAELDDAESREGVYVIAATDKPDAVHTDLLRPGRLGTHLYVPLPNEQERGSILKALVGTKWLKDADVDLLAIGRSEAWANFSGADLFLLVPISFLDATY